MFVRGFMSFGSMSTSKTRILAYGELLWDMLPTGKKLGGAPVNFLYHAKTLGSEVRALTSVGDDELGKEILARFDELGIPRDALQISKLAPTGVVDVKLDSKGTPSYQIVENVAWDDIRVDSAELEKTLQFLTEPGYRSAFYYGSLALRTAENKSSLLRILDATPSNVSRVCDLNLRAPFYDRDTILLTLENADVYKLNDVEAIELDQMFDDKITSTLARLGDSDASLSAVMRDDLEKVKRTLSSWADAWLETYDLKTIVLTCGASGAFLFNRDEIAFSPSIEVAVKDSVGAGDSFAAVCVVGLLNDRPYSQIVEAASRRAAFVCSREGGTPNVPDDLTRPFD